MAGCCIASDGARAKASSAVISESQSSETLIMCAPRPRACWRLGPSEGSRFELLARDFAVTVQKQFASLSGFDDFRPNSFRGSLLDEILDQVLIGNCRLETGRAPPLRKRNVGIHGSHGKYGSRSQHSIDIPDSAGNGGRSAACADLKVEKRDVALPGLAREKVDFTREASFQR